EYKHWIETEKPFATVEAEVAVLSKRGADFRRIIAPEREDRLRGFMEFLEQFDIRTGYPLLLFFFEAGITSDEWTAVAGVLESYLLRRAVCGNSTKGYNRIFLQLTKSLRKAGASAAALESDLLELRGESAEWPTDEKFSAAWQSWHAYQTLNNSKI